jgi:hypothetical protein
MILSACPIVKSRTSGGSDWGCILEGRTMRNYGLVIGLFWGLMIEAAVVALGLWLL